MCAMNIREVRSEYGKAHKKVLNDVLNEAIVDIFKAIIVAEEVKMDIKEFYKLLNDYCKYRKENMLSSELSTDMCSNCLMPYSVCFVRQLEKDLDKAIEILNEFNKKKGVLKMPVAKKPAKKAVKAAKVVAKKIAKVEKVAKKATKKIAKKSK